MVEGRWDICPPQEPGFYWAYGHRTRVALFRDEPAELLCVQAMRGEDGRMVYRCPGGTLNFRSMCFSWLPIELPELRGYGRPLGPGNDDDPACTVSRADGSEE